MGEKYAGITLKFVYPELLVLKLMPALQSSRCFQYQNISSDHDGTWKTIVFFNKHFIDDRVFAIELQTKGK